jgi:DNA modification methylase
LPNILRQPFSFTRARQELTGVAGEIVTIGRATLYLGDCRDILPTLDKVDAVVTDPPYGIGADKAAAKNEGKWGWKFHGHTDWDGERPPREVFDAMRAVSREQIIWGGNYFTDHLPPTMRWLVWDKGQRGFSLADCEFAWSSQQKAARVLDYPRGAANASAEKEHPTQKPLKVMRWCLDFVPDAKTILDPFMGTGTTGVAAVHAGKSFIGIEAHEPYFEIACRRIREANGDDAGPLFGAAA